MQCWTSSLVSLVAILEDISSNQNMAPDGVSKLFGEAKP